MKIMALKKIMGSSLTSLQNIKENGFMIKSSMEIYENMKPRTIRISNLFLAKSRIVKIYVVYITY
jgi:hypothetical protein